MLRVAIYSDFLAARVADCGKIDVLAVIVFEFSLAAERLQVLSLVIYQINHTAVYLVVTGVFGIRPAAERVAVVAALGGYDTVVYDNVVRLTGCT